MQFNSPQNKRQTRQRGVILVMCALSFKAGGSLACVRESFSPAVMLRFRTSGQQVFAPGVNLRILSLLSDNRSTLGYSIIRQQINLKEAKRKANSNKLLVIYYIQMSVSGDHQQNDQGNLRKTQNCEIQLECTLNYLYYNLLIDFKSLFSCIFFALNFNRCKKNH